MIFFSKTQKTATDGTKRAVVRVLSFKERELLLIRFSAVRSTEQEAKSMYAARTTRGHRFGGVMTTPRGRDLFLLVLFLG